MQGQHLSLDTDFCCLRHLHLGRVQCCGLGSVASVVPAFGGAELVGPLVFAQAVP